VVTARNRQPSTSYSRSTSQRFSLRDPVICFLKVDKTCVDIFGVLPRFLEDLLDSENLVCSATSGAKTVLGILQFWFKCHTAHFYKALDVHFSTEDRERCHGVFFHVSPLVYVDDHPSFPIFQYLSRTPGHLTQTNQPKNSSIHGFEHFRSDFLATCSFPSLQ